MIYVQNYKSPYGELLLGSYNDELVLCDWKYRKMRSSIDARIQKALRSQFIDQKAIIHDQTISQLEEYFTSTRTEFSIPIKLIGTDFQQSVWEALQKIPFGETKSYLTLSKKLGNEKAIRAVASANGANAISILIPCHRVIGSKGELTGYAGGVTAKQKLLDLEGAGSQQLDLF